jgi:hypothetical protein
MVRFEKSKMAAKMAANVLKNGLYAFYLPKLVIFSIYLSIGDVKTLHPIGKI